MIVREPLVIAVVQPRSRSDDLAGNCERHAAAVRAASARVVVFPELSLTGYELDAAPVSTADPILATIVDACRETGTVAFAGAPVRGDTGRVHIAMLAFDRSGATIVYRKMWLGDAEAERFTPGRVPTVVDIDGWRLGLAICKDTGEPQHASETAALGLDVYVAGVLESSEDAEVQPARARRVARDHGVWVAVASFAGSTGGGYSRAAGCSGIWRPDGSTAARVGAEVGAVARAVVE